MNNWYWIRLVAGLGLAAVALSRIFLDDAEAHVTMCMIAAAIYGMGLMIPNKDKAAFVTSLAFFGIAFYTVYSATTFLAYEQFFAGPSFSPNDQIVPGIDFAWVYHTIINFYLLGLFWFGLDRMRWVYLGLSIWLMGAPLMFIFAAMGRDLWMDYEPPMVIIGYAVAGLAIRWSYSILKRSPEIFDNFLKSLRKFIIISLWIYVVISLIPYIQLTLGYNNAVSRIDESSNSSSQSTPTFNLSSIPKTELERQWGKNCNSNGPTSLSFAPISPDNLDHIAPYGLMGDAHVTPVDHQYWVPKNATREPISTSQVQYSIVAPADGRIVSIQHFGGAVISDNPQAPTIDDYFIAMQHSCTLYTYLIHLTHPREDIITAAGHKPHESETWNATIDIPIGAGESIGANAPRSFDFAVMDTTTTLPGFISPELYKQEAWKIHVVDPLKYFPVQISSQLESKMVRQAEPRSGKFDHDVAGTAQGNWFVEGTNGYEGTKLERYWSTHLSISPHYIDPSAIVVSFGGLEGESRQYMVTDTTFDPKEIMAGSGVQTIGLIGFEVVDSQGKRWEGLNYRDDLRVDQEPNRGSATLILEVLPGERLRAEVVTGGEPKGFSVAAPIYER